MQKRKFKIQIIYLFINDLMCASLNLLYFIHNLNTENKDYNDLHLNG